MTDFITRVELREAQAPHREALDEAMEARNFWRTLTLANGIEYQLPEGTYFSQSFNMAAQDVKNLATAAAHSTGRRYAIVTASGDIAYSLHPCS